MVERALSALEVTCSEDRSLLAAAATHVLRAWGFPPETQVEGLVDSAVVDGMEVPRPSLPIVLSQWAARLHLADFDSVIWAARARGLQAHDPVCFPRLARFWNLAFPQ